MSYIKEYPITFDSISDKIHYIKLPSYAEIIINIKFPDSKKIKNVELYNDDFKLLSVIPNKDGIIDLKNYPIGMVLFNSSILFIYGDLDKKDKIYVTYKFLDPDAREKLAISKIKYGNYKIVDGYLTPI